MVVDNWEDGYDVIDKWIRRYFLNDLMGGIYNCKGGGEDGWLSEVEEVFENELG